MNNYKRPQCVFCGNPLTTLLSGAGRRSKYCSALCRNRANHQKAIDEGRIAKRCSEIKEKRKSERLATQQICARCGKAFFDERKRKYCRKCTGAKEWTELTWTHGFRRPPCKWCGKPCAWHGNVGYCSQECACADKVYRHRYEKEKDEVLFALGLLEYVSEEFLRRQKEALAKKLLRLLRVVLRKRREEEPRPTTKAKVCRWCGKTFMRPISRYGSVAYCSEECSTAAFAEQRRKGRKKYRASLAGKEYKRSTNNNRKRARRYHCSYDSSIRRIEVFERDGWRCRICGRKTPKRLLGKNKPNAPTLDHILPLSLGGGHTWNNVQCACRQCNSEKSNRFVQEWLFPL